MQRVYPKHTPRSSLSRAFPFLTAMVISTLVTLATFLPLLFRFGLTAPLPEGDTTIYSPSSLYPDPNPCYGNNSGIHDPSIIYEDGTYWRFSTSGNIAVATAPSMKGPWKYRSPLLPQGTKIHVADDQDIWVPYLAALKSRMGSWLTVQGPIDIQIWQVLLHSLLSQHHGLASLSNRRGNRLITVWALDGSRLPKHSPAPVVQPH